MADPNEVAQLAQALTSGQTYTSLTVQNLNQPLGQGESIVIGYGTGTTQTVTAQGSSLGAQTIPVTSFVANADYAAGQLIGLIAATLGHVTVDAQPAVAVSSLPALPATNDELLLELRKISAAMQLLVLDHGFNVDLMEVVS